MAIMQSSFTPVGLLPHLQSDGMDLLLKLFQANCLVVFLCLSNKPKQSRRSALTASHTAGCSFSPSVLTAGRLDAHTCAGVCVYVCPRHVSGGVRVFSVAELWWSLCSSHHNSLVQWDHWMRLSASDVVTVTPTGQEMF